jgi:protein TonB
MFEDSLVESSGRIRTRTQRYAAPSLALQAALVAVLVLIPYVNPDVLPHKFLNVPLIAPPVPVAPAPVEHVAPTQVAQSEEFEHTLVAPPTIPTLIHQIVDAVPPGPISGDFDSGSRTGSVSMLPILPTTRPPGVRDQPAKPTGPIHVSEGVAAGQLIVPIQPHYPAIALATHQQGTVVVAAIISTEGHIQSLRVLSGPPMLVPAAVDAIRRARYRPWTLNGEPVEVETTINVVFSFGSN